MSVLPELSIPALRSGRISQKEADREVSTSREKRIKFQVIRTLSGHPEREELRKPQETEHVADDSDYQSDFGHILCLDKAG